MPLNLYLFWPRRSDCSENTSKMSFTFSTFLTRIFAADCPAGSYSPLNRTCSLCPRGTYQPSRGRASCISCGPSLTTHSSGTVDKKHCISKSIKSVVIFSRRGRQILALPTRIGTENSDLKKISWSGRHCKHSDIETFFVSHLNLLRRSYKEQRNNYVFLKKLLQIIAFGLFRKLIFSNQLGFEL